MNRSKSVRHHLQKLYNGVLGNGLDREYDPKHATTYGELTLEGAEQLVQEYENVKSIESFPPERRVFYDLGSGTGKIVMMVAHLVPSLQSYGIELVKHRHDKAVKVLSQLSRKTKNVHFIEGSLFDHNIRNAGWIFLSNLCFSNEVNEDVARKIEQEVREDTLIACSVELPLQDPKAFYHTEFSLPMTWEKNSVMHLYKKL